MAGVEWKEVEQEGQNPVWVENIEDIKHLWTTAMIPFRAWGCFQLDLLRIIKSSTSRLDQFQISSAFPGGLFIFLHKKDQALDKRMSKKLQTYDIRLETQAKWYTNNKFEIDLEVIRSKSTKNHQCSTSAFDPKLTLLATDEMLKEAGCVVHFVDRPAGASICDGGDVASKKAYKIFTKYFSDQSLYDREDLPPPCEYFIPSVVLEEKGYNDKRINPDKNHLTSLTTIYFMPQVSMYVCLCHSSQL